MNPAQKIKSLNNELITFDNQQPTTGVVELPTCLLLCIRSKIKESNLPQKSKAKQATR
jgi:hypothetical protein